MDLNLSQGVLKESKLLGTIQDFEMDPFEVELISNDNESPDFITARLNEANEWRLDIDYDPSKYPKLRNDQQFSYGLKVK